MERDVSKAISTLSSALQHNEELFNTYRQSLSSSFFEEAKEYKKENGIKMMANKSLLHIANKAALRFLHQFMK